jgi:hypothetical protein
MKPQNKTSDNHYDFFISGRWRNRDALLALAKKIREKGYSVYCFLESKHNSDSTVNDPEVVMQQFESRDWQNDTLVKEIFETDMQAQRESDAFVMLLPAGKSCHIEAGAAYGMGKRCILIGEQKEAESLYCIFTQQFATSEAFLETF